MCRFYAGIVSHGVRLQCFHGTTVALPRCSSLSFLFCFLGINNSFFSFLFPLCFGSPILGRAINCRWTVSDTQRNPQSRIRKSVNSASILCLAARRFIGCNSWGKTSISLVVVLTFPATKPQRKFHILDEPSRPYASHPLRIDALLDQATDTFSAPALARRCSPEDDDESAELTPLCDENPHAETTALSGKS